jgi:hypothetical protein
MLLTLFMTKVDAGRGLKRPGPCSASDFADA